MKDQQTASEVLEAPAPSKIRIVGTPGGHGTQLFIDGKELIGLRRIEFSVSVNEPPTLTLELVTLEVDIDGWARVTKEPAK